MKLSWLFQWMFLVMAFEVNSQELYQTIRGKVLDKSSELPLIGATILLANSNPINGSVTDLNGNFRFSNIPIGRKEIIVSFLGYETARLNNIDVNSKKEIVLTIKLEEKAFIGNEFVVSSEADKRQANNKMATVSARTFSVDESKRYAGSLNDVSRMAQNYAGVQSADDARNDLVIRGNSSIGVLYRLEGVDIPNPNHFSFFGSTGGPVSILNNNLLSNSDFYTGAFPAEFGNAIAGVFDLKLRNGNNEKNEFMGQFGINGFEAMAEGPIKKKQSSFLVNLRYNNLDFYKKLGVNLGTQAVPTYFDGTFRLHFTHKKGYTALFGLGGSSYVEFLDSERNEDESFFNNDASDLLYSTTLAATGLIHTRLIKNGYVKFTLSYNYSKNNVSVDTINPGSVETFSTYKNNSVQGKYSAYLVYNKKLCKRHLLKAGVMADQLFFNLDEKFYDNQLNTFLFRQKFDGTTQLLQPFAQWKFKLSENFDLNAGIHSLLYLFNYTSTIEPRIGLQYKLKNTDLLSLGYGLHGQVAPSSIYFKRVNRLSGSYPNPNKNLTPYKSHQLVLSYDHFVNTKVRTKAELYYQKLVDVPVGFRSSSYSLLNQGADFGFGFPDTLTNAGFGMNYGLEFTLEQFLNRGFYYLVTTSLFESKYQPSDGNWYNTVFNTNYSVNVLTGKEFEVFKNKSSKRRHLINFNGRFVANGGQRYTPILKNESLQKGEIVTDQSKVYHNKYKDYIRLDFKIGWKFDGHKVSQEVSFDIQNVTNRKNIFNQEFDIKTGETNTRYQLGRLPVVLYRIYF